MYPKEMLGEEDEKQEEIKNFSEMTSAEIFNKINAAYEATGEKEEKVGVELRFSALIDYYKLRERTSFLENVPEESYVDESRPDLKILSVLKQIGLRLDKAESAEVNGFYLHYADSWDRITGLIKYCNLLLDQLPQTPTENK